MAPSMALGSSPTQGGKVFRALLSPKPPPHASKMTQPWLHLLPCLLCCWGGLPAPTWVPSSGILGRRLSVRGCPAYLGSPQPAFRRTHGGGRAGHVWLAPCRQVLGLGAGGREPGLGSSGTGGPCLAQHDSQPPRSLGSPALRCLVCASTRGESQELLSLHPSPRASLDSSLATRPWPTRFNLSQPVSQL